MGPSESALVNASSWADQAVDIPAYAWSRDLHFSSTPYRACSEYNQTRDCGNGSGRCIVTAIANYTNRAADFGLPRDERAEALKFLIHFVGDAHSGLHVGFAEDAGGNLIHLGDPQMSLHEVWDSFLLDSFKQLSELTSWGRVSSELVGMIAGSPDLVADALLDSAQLQSAGSVIASETATTVTCDSAYKNDGKWLRSGDSLSQEYIADSAGVAINRLIKAGIRLAQLLDAVAASFYSQERAAELASVSSQSPSGSSNRFSGLDFDFDPEEAVFELIVDEPVQLDEDPEGTPDDAPVTTTRRSPEAKRAAKNKAKKLREAAKKSRIDGVNVEAIVLIKRGRAFHVTYKHLVESDDWTPSAFGIVAVMFPGSKSPEVFFFDADVFSWDKPISRVLLEATLRHLKGLPLTTSFESMDFSASIVGADVEVRKPVVGSTLTLDGLNLQLYGEAEFDSVKDLVRPRLAPAQLKALYRGKVPSLAKQQIDILNAEADQIISLNFGPIMLVLRADDMLDLSRTRWVFNLFSYVDSRISLTNTNKMYVDARLIDSMLTSDAIRELGRISERPRNQDLLRRVLKRDPPLLNRMYILSTFFGMNNASSVCSLYVAAAFERTNQIHRPGNPNFTTVEYVLRDDAEMMRVIQALELPPFDKFYAAYLASRSQLRAAGPGTQR